VRVPGGDTACVLFFLEPLTAQLDNNSGKEGNTVSSHTFSALPTASSDCLLGKRRISVPSHVALLYRFFLTLKSVEKWHSYCKFEGPSPSCKDYANIYKFLKQCPRDVDSPLFN